MDRVRSYKYNNQINIHYENYRSIQYFLDNFLLYYALTLVTDISSQTAAGIGQPLRMDQLGNMKAMIESICVGRLALCQDLMTIVNATETSVNQAQAELQAGNSTGAMMMLSNE